ncbi:hypothetical protein KKG05_02535 [bacterium]|nr:hypothetical protein [bacterium]
MRKILIIILSIALLVPPAIGASKKSKERGDAFLKSLVLPGWGQYDSGHKKSAVLFALTECAIIGGMVAFNAHGAAKRDDYKALASLHAGVVGDHSHDFYVDIGNWDNVDDYNEQRLQDREFDRLYTSTLDYWEWDSQASRVEMEKIRIQSDKAFNAVYYLIGGIVLNHIASAIHAGRVASTGKAEATSSSRAWHLGFTPHARSQGLSVHLSCAF